MLNKIESLQFFLEMMMQSSYSQEWLIYDIADTLGLNKDELLNSKSLQLDVINSLK